MANMSFGKKAVNQTGGAPGSAENVEEEKTDETVLPPTA